MKKITILFFALSIQLTAFGGSFSLVISDSIRTISSSYIVAFAGTVTNLDSNTIDITMEVTSNSLPNGWKFAMCTPDGCYPDGVNPVSFDLSDSESGYTAVHFNVGPTEAVGYLTVRWSNTLDLTDFIEVNFEVSFVTTSIPKFEKSNSFLNIYPNPVQGRSVISYKLNSNEGQIIIVNTLGEEVSVYNLATRSGKVSINDDLSLGLYFCVLMENGSMVNRSKMIVID